MQVGWNGKVMRKGVWRGKAWESMREHGKGIKGQRENGEQGCDDQSIVDD